MQKRLHRSHELTELCCSSPYNHVWKCDYKLWSILYTIKYAAILLLGRVSSHNHYTSVSIIIDPFVINQQIKVQFQTLFPSGQHPNFDPEHSQPWRSGPEAGVNPSSQHPNSADSQPEHPSSFDP